LIKELRTEGWGRLLVGLSITTFVILAILLFHAPVAFVLVGAALVSVLVFVNAHSPYGRADVNAQPDIVAEERHD
jgi:hypothetical protein